MTTTTDYNAHASGLLAAFGVTFTATLLGIDCPTYCQDKEASRDMDKLGTYPRKSHMHGKHYLITLTRIDHGRAIGYSKAVSFDFWNSYNDEEYNHARKHKQSTPDRVLLRHGIDPNKFYDGKHKTDRVPTPYDVLACLTKSYPGTFKDFCSDFGYSTDSIQAQSTYQAVFAEWGKLSAFFTTAEIDQLQEVA